MHISSLYENSILLTDGYKITMALAGSPLRKETFYLSFRRGGPYFIPFDIKEYIDSIIKEFKWDNTHEDFLKNKFHPLNSSMSYILSSAKENKDLYQMTYVPQGHWFCAKEPIVTITGPSFLVSWIETQIIWLQYAIQLATYLKRGNRKIKIICNDQEKITSYIAKTMNLHNVIEYSYDEDYNSRVRTKIKEIVDLVSPDRIVEGGLRSAISPDHHKIVLSAMKDYGILKTSNMQGAMELDMIPGGTVGHEHTQRVGSDFRAYQNSVERVPGLSGCLLDTWSTINSGIPAAMKIAQEYPDRQFLSRLDSGNKEAFFLYYADLLKKNKIDNQIINIAGDVNKETIQRFETLCEMADWPKEKLSYMVGGKITCETLELPFNRNTASAVYKLSCSGNKPVMKFGDDFNNGKQSWPGVPVIWRRRMDSDLPIGIVAQIDEEIDSRHYTRLDQAQTFDLQYVGSFFMQNSINSSQIVPSNKTRELMKDLSK